MTWGTAGIAALRNGAVGGVAGGAMVGAPTRSGFPQRPQVGVVAGFMLPQYGQRV